MAIKINIEGIGDISVEGAAQEDTLQSILEAVKKTERTKAAEEKKLKKAAEDTAKAMAKTKSEFEEFEDTLKDASKETEESAGKGSKAFSELADAGKKTVKGLGSFAGTLALTATSIGVSFAKSFNENAANPIAVGAALLATGFDIMGQGLKIGVEAVSALSGALLGAVPLIGGGLQRGIDGLAAVSKAVIDTGVTVLKAGNEMMSAEFQMTTKVMADMSKAGASFAGGMTEMRQIANQSGIGIEQFGKVIASSRDSITGMGLSATEATQRLSKGMGALTTTVGRSGNTLRSEMLALGYSYAEQGEMMAQYAANQRAAGRLKQMTDSELAAGTAQYAKDLKVLADITGKDAKKAMEEAQQASLQADIMAQLSPEEAEKFQKGYAAMPDYAKKGFLQYVASGGQAISDATTNVIMSQNSRIGEMIRGTYDGIKNSSKSASQVQTETLKRASEAGVAQRELNKAQGNQIALANTMGGGMQEYATAINQVTASALYNAEAVDASGKAAEKNAETQDPVTKGFAQATDAVVAFQMKMATLATEMMPLYASAIGTATSETTKIVTAAMQLASGKITMKEFAELMNIPGTDGVNDKNRMSKKLEADRERREDELAAAQDKLKWGSRTASKAAGTSESFADTEEIKIAKQNLKDAREAESKLLLAKRTYTAGLEEALGKLREHATEEEKTAATLKYNQKFIDDSAKGNVVTSKDILGGRTTANAKGMADNFVLPTQANPSPTTATPADTKGKAKGGISTGPVSGYHEVLHGTEAVVPLPDNKSIPVKLDSSSLTATLNEQTGLLNNILESLNKGNNLTSGILQNSY